MRTILFTVVCAACVGCSTLPSAQTKPPKIDSFPRLVKEGRVMPLSELVELLAQAKRDGMPLRGYGLTVFEGTKIERFDIEIVDVAKNFIFPKHDLIMFRGSHKKWLDGGNVIAGMSGSPCYINDKMIGALSYRLGTFQKDALGGITPIEYMVREMDRPTEDSRLRIERESEFARGWGERGPMPVMTPVMASGFSPRTLAQFEKPFEEQNYVLAPSGGGSAVVAPDDAFIEGGAIGASLMLGDYDITATGTVTLVDGDRVLAFGHPFFGVGEIELPLTTCVVHTTFQGLMTAYKISSPHKVIGALVHDRANAIAGRIGATARMIPVSITVRNPKTKTEHVVRVQCLDHPTYLPLLISMAHAQSLNTFEPSEKANVTTSNVSLRLAGGRTLQYANVEQYDPTTAFVGFGGSGGLFGRVHQLLRNEYEKPVLEGVEIVTERVGENKSASLKAVWVQPAEVKAGGAVEVHCVMKRFRGADVTKVIPLILPKDLESGTEIEVLVGGGSAIAPDRAPSSNLTEFLEALATEYTATSLVAVANLPSYQLLYHGRILESMPNSVLAQVVPTIDETAYLAHGSHRVALETEWLIAGRATVKIKVK